MFVSVTAPVDEANDVPLLAALVDGSVDDPPICVDLRKNVDFCCLFESACCKHILLASVKGQSANQIKFMQKKKNKDI